MGDISNAIANQISQAELSWAWISLLSRDVNLVDSSDLAGSLVE